jgi:Rps23 Pro-64 3,4-dihydroxylase Tpa1-like proline 4-hydroxylase
MMELFDEERSQSLARALRAQYATAEPFPHIVIDDFLPEDICEGILQEFPAPDQIPWRRFEKHYARKLATRGEAQFGESTRATLRQLNSATCLRFLETLTGISGLIPDLDFEGGGLHQIERGGFVKIHLDSNKHPRYPLVRRINLLLYLNKVWRDEYRGHLELWDKEMRRCVCKVLPVFNRCVIFNTNDVSYHGHPDRLECPPEMTRKSVAIYYYTDGRPTHDGERDHGTIWRERPTSRSERRPSAGPLRRLVSALKSPGEPVQY